MEVLEHPQRDAPDRVLRDAREDSVAKLVEAGRPSARHAVPECKMIIDLNQLSTL